MAGSVDRMRTACKVRSSGCSKGSHDNDARSKADSGVRGLIRVAAGISPVPVRLACWRRGSSFRGPGRTRTLRVGKAVVLDQKPPVAGRTAEDGRASFPTERHHDIARLADAPESRGIRPLLSRSGYQDAHGLVGAKNANMNEMRITPPMHDHGPRTTALQEPL